MKKISQLLIVFSTAIGFAQAPCSLVTASKTSTNYSFVSIPAQGVYYANGATSTTGIITSNANTVSNTTFIAKNKISLTNGFKATSTSGKFVAVIGNCDVIPKQSETIVAKVSQTQETKAVDTEAKSIAIFPNPTSNEINITWTNYQINTIIIYCLDGRKIMEKEVSNKENSFYYNVTHLPSGIYTLTMQTNEGTIAKKFIKL